MTIKYFGLYLGFTMVWDWLSSLIAKLLINGFSFATLNQEERSNIAAIIPNMLCNLYLVSFRQILVDIFMNIHVQAGKLTLTVQSKFSNRTWCHSICSELPLRVCSTLLNMHLSLTYRPNWIPLEVISIVISFNSKVPILLINYKSLLLMSAIYATSSYHLSLKNI